MNENENRLQSNKKLQAENRGKLRIFLGYAAGVGKTYAMLKAAQQRQAEGTDVLVAYIETHGQAETDKLLEGLEILPPKLVSHRGNILKDLDLDAVLKRAPELVLIDEFAHTNAASLRHLKRYQDVEELLDAGIDVYTTLNVQDIESLNDIIAQITAVTVDETVPDRLIHVADEIELIDILPEDLLHRLELGKVYIAESGERGLKKFFRLGNLTALRELAMRQAALRVDEQMRAYMQNQAILGPWPAHERLLVAVSASPRSARLVRTTCRLAQQLDAPWYAVYVETPHPFEEDEENQSRINQSLWLAESLGAMVATITGQEVASALVNFARENNVTKIVVGQSLRSRWQEFWRGSVINELSRESGEIDVYVISSSETETKVISANPSRFAVTWKSIAFAFITILFATIAGIIVHSTLSISPVNIVMIYLLAVAFVSLRTGYGTAVLASLLGVLSFDFFFIPPELTFHVTDAQYIITFIGLFVVGMVIADLTARARLQTEAAYRREQQTARLYSLSRELSATVDFEQMAQSILQHLKQILHCETILFRAENNRLEMHYASFEGEIAEAEKSVARWVFENEQLAGNGTNTLPSVKGRYLPLKTAQSHIGVLGLMLEKPLNPEQQRLVDAFAAQAALALEASQLAAKAQQTELLREKEKLQSILLNSISHDLRTPLVSITGALSSLRDDRQSLNQAVRQDLVEAAYEESERLNRLVGNLLEMSRLQAGSLKLRREFYDIQEIISVARAQLGETLEKRDLQVEIEPNLPLLSVDLVLFAQVLVNLLDNATKYSAPNTPIQIRAYQNKVSVILEIADRGIGIPEHELAHIFEKFYRATTSNGRSGSGLGLSICEGIVELHDGSIHAENRKDGGARFLIYLPLAQAKLMLTNEGSKNPL